MQDISSIGRFYKNEGFYLEGVWLWRISGGYSQGMMGIGNAFPTVLPNADYSYYTLKTSGFKTFW